MSWIGPSGFGWDGFLGRVNNHGALGYLGAKRYGVYGRLGIRWRGLRGLSTRRHGASAYLWVPRGGRSTWKYSTAGRG